MSDDAISWADRWRDGAVAGEELATLRARLRGDVDFRREFVADIRLGGAIAALLADDPAALAQRVEDALHAGRPSELARFADRVEARLPRESSRRRRRPRAAASPWLRFAVPAALAAGLVLGIVAVQRAGARRTLPVIDLAAGVAEVQHDATTHAARAGERLAAGDAVSATSGEVTLAYADGTRFTLSTGAVAIADHADGAKRLNLERGALAATVAKQPPGQPLVIAAGAARVEVKGTAFTLAVDAGGTRLDVSEGLVAFIPRSGGPIAVAAGEAASATAAGARSYPIGASALRDPAALVAAIAPRPDELRYREIPWELDLRAAHARAVAEGKPLLIWSGWGHPFGMGDATTLQARRIIAADPVFARQADERFVPVVVDSWMATRRGDAVGRFFAAVAHAERGGERTYDGFFAARTDGTTIGDLQGDADPAAARQMLAHALAAAPGGAPFAFAGDNEARFDPHPPAGALIAVTHARALERSGGGWRGSGPSGVDHLWLAAGEWRALAPAGEAAVAIDPAVAGKIARYALLDSTRSEQAPWPEAAMREVSLSARVVERTPARIRAELTGSVDLEDGPRAFRATVAGGITIDVAADRPTAFALVAAGAWRDEAVGDRLLGVTSTLATGAPDDLVPPHGTRDLEYLQAGR